MKGQFVSSMDTIASKGGNVLLLVSSELFCLLDGQLLFIGSIEIARPPGL